MENRGAKLEEFERAVYGRLKADRCSENDAAFRAMHGCLVQMREGAGFENHGNLTTGDMTRFCSAVVALFMDPGFNLTQDGFNYLCAEKAVLDTVFRASAYESADFVFQMMSPGEKSPEKFLPLLSLATKVPFEFEKAFRENPQATVGLYLALIGYGQVLSKEGHELREKLLAMADIFKDVDLHPALWNTVCSAYMHCSYAVGEHKHDCKRLIHGILRKHLKEAEPKELEPLYRKEKPKVLCVLEWWHSSHAMYRSYARSIIQLAAHFTLVGCCVGKNTDEAAKAPFSKWIQIDSENLNVAVLAKQIADEKPDVIYFPSIGMGVWAISLASLRLAPIQVMSYGHPATSNSPVIDYGLIEDDCLTRECFSEKMIGLPPNAVRPTAFQKIETRHTPRKTDRVKVAICAMQVKVTHPFVQTLRTAQLRAKEKGKEMEFRFFSATHGIGMFSFAKDLAGQLENVWAHETQAYPDYMKSVADCDIVLFSFPFGGANSAYDAVTLGMPMVSLKGKQPHEMSDASIQARCGLPADLTTHSVEEYIDKLVELVVDDERRIAVANAVAAVDVESRFYQDDDGRAFVNAFLRMYEENCQYGVIAGERKAA